MQDEFGANNLIYNRFDVIYPEDFTIVDIDGYHLAFHKEGKCAEINIWGKYVSDETIDRAIEKYVRDNSDVFRCIVQRTRNNYKNILFESKEVVLDLPSDYSSLLERLTSKERYHLRWNLKHLNEFGEVSVNHYDRIPLELVSYFFCWKKSTHGRDYNMSEHGYLETYHVTNAIDMLINGKPIAVLFYCAVEDTVYLENFSYDEQYAKYSPGYMLFIEFLKEMVRQRKTTVYLGGAELAYKEKFEARICSCFSGYIYTTTGIDRLKRYLNSVETFALYGYGKLGHIVYELLIQIGVKPQYILDKNEIQIDRVDVYKSEDISSAKKVNEIIITMKNHALEVEELLKKNGFDYIYWDDLVEFKL